MHQERPRSLSFLAVVREGLDDLTFEPPAEWNQRTIVGFNAPNPESYAYPPGVVMMRDTMAEEDSLETIVERHLTELLQLPEVQVTSPTAYELDGQSAVELEFEWKSGTCVLAQTTLIVASCTGMRRTVTTFTTFCAREDLDALRPMFARIFESVRFAPPYAVTKSDVAPAGSTSDVVPSSPLRALVPPPPPDSDATLVTITSVIDVESSFKEVYGESFNVARDMPRAEPRIELRPPPRLSPPPPKPAEDMDIPEVPMPGPRAPRQE
jgi:hypothetical protein